MLSKKQVWIVGPLLAFVLLGCTLPGWLRARVPTATPTSEPTASPTAGTTARVTASPATRATAGTPTLAATTPSATPDVASYDLSDVHLQARDLPGMFVGVDVSTLGIDEGQLSQGDLKVENLDMFVSLFPPEFVITFLILPEAGVESAEIDVLLDNPERLFGMFESAAGGVRNREVWPEAPDVGEKAAGLSATVTINDDEMDMDAIVFRRDLVVAVVADIHAKGGSPTVPLEETALLLDERLQQAMQEG